jgi:hypothetical protein
MMIRIYIDVRVVNVIYSLTETLHLHMVRRMAAMSRSLHVVEVFCAARKVSIHLKMLVVGVISSF